MALKCKVCIVGWLHMQWPSVSLLELDSLNFLSCQTAFKKDDSLSEPNWGQVSPIQGRSKVLCTVYRSYDGMLAHYILYIPPIGLENEPIMTAFAFTKVFSAQCPELIQMTRKFLSKDTNHNFCKLLQRIGHITNRCWTRGLHYFANLKMSGILLVDVSQYTNMEKVNDRFNVWNHWSTQFLLTGQPFTSLSMDEASVTKSLA